MKFKIDENLPVELAEMLNSEGYDASTIYWQNMGGEPDTNVALVCKAEERVIVTLDIGFADIRTYPPEQFPGIIVIRSKAQDKFTIIECFERVIPLLKQEPLYQKLWIVEKDRVRIRE